ncbi:hypothetical protein CI105_05640, partial [Candidatus Izimaplasma bacterium ZiA1]|uniref:ComEC/Rec2 family competence protein n=1 Tax=Candidatus Izimoplasma sp. ZiA1 TaxID=2024899 RepID=UPI000BD7339A
MISQYKHNIFYVTLMITLIYLLTCSYVYLFPFSLYILFLCKRKKQLLKLIILVSIIFILNFHIKRPPLKENDFYICVIKEVEKKDNSTLLKCKINKKKVLVYTTDHFDFTPGDSYKVFGELKTIESNTFDNGFNYQLYLKSKNIYNTIYASNLVYESHDFDIGIIRHQVLIYIESLGLKTVGYIKTFVLASKDDLDPLVVNSINGLGISHMFAISGLHTRLIIVFLSKLLKKNKYQVPIILAVLFTYLLLTNFTASLLRSSLFYVLIIINKKYKKPFDNLDLLSIVFLMLILYNPF